MDQGSNSGLLTLLKKENFNDYFFEYTQFILALKLLGTLVDFLDQLIQTFIKEK